MKIVDFLDNFNVESDGEVVVEVPESAKPGSTCAIKGVRYEGEPQKAIIELET